VNDPNTSLLVITKDNSFFELKSFLKHGHFVCKLAQINSPILRENSSLTLFKIVSKKPNMTTCILSCFNPYVQFSGLRHAIMQAFMSAPTLIRTTPTHLCDCLS